MQSFKSLRDKLGNYADIQKLKMELTKVRKQIHALRTHLSPDAQRRLKKLQKRFMDLRNQVLKLQKQLDSEFSLAVRKWQLAKKETETFVKHYIHSARPKRKGSKKTTSRKATRKSSGKRK